MGKLTAAKVKAVIDQPGRYSDGDGLILFVRAPGQASWVARVQHNGKRRDYGLGSAKLFKLAEARDRAWEVRRALVDGRDPRTLWQQPAPLLRTFKEAAEDFLEALGAKELGERRLKQGRSQLTRYAFPSLGRLQVQSLDAERIAECLRPIWTAKPETARQVRSLIERILRFARPDGPQFAGTLGPAISDRLPKQPAKGNHKALPYQELPALMERLQEKTGMGALALRMTILCASRSGEIRGATWDEIDFDRGVWTIPGERMKAGKPHRVPLTSQALAVLEEAAKIRRSDHIFPNGKGVALSDMALTKTLRDMGMTCTAHGFRSSFRDWAAEQTSVAGEIAEAALAHAVPNAVEAAYKRTDFFDRRRDLMDAWARYATGGESGEVVQMVAAS
ncbi:MAG: tyrosine-type recombinase/integrase [Novosphingobium sp.]|nr:tyrosine-type recombinase/integrase [Novosphingobium sp.]